MKMYYFIQFLRIRIQSWLSWVVPAQGHSWGCSKAVSWGCRHLKAWLGWEDPLPRRRTHAWKIRAGCWQEASVPSLCRPLTEMLKYPRDTAVGFSQSEGSRRKPQSLMIWTLSVASTLFWSLDVSCEVWATLQRGKFGSISWKEECHKFMDLL